MFLKIILTLGLILGILAVIVARQPDEFRISRTLQMNAVPAQITPYLLTMKRWNEWSPWAKLDPQATITYEGPESGVGAGFSWKGNNEVGEGRMTVLEATDNLVRYRLEFTSPFVATNTADFDLKVVGAQTEVTWSMYGTSSFISKAMGLIMDCDKMVGTQFEKGLATLKGLTEAKPE